jgi:hypothetical protein
MNESTLTVTSGMPVRCYDLVFYSKTYNATYVMHVNIHVY